jgi:hypothetical protein
MIITNTEFVTGKEIKEMKQRSSKTYWKRHQSRI